MAAIRKSCSEVLSSVYRFLRRDARRDFLPATCQFHSSANLRDSNRTSIVRCGRKTYSRTYPVSLIQPDGSTVTIQYREPRRILVMPVDITSLSEEERRARLRRRDQARKSSIKREKEDFGDEFSADEYSKFWKKK
ncbi:39S ribosomal protein L55, mitochondrial [Spea bombifrons]|uniref:39S ribosomal protein L55, mitochondrial n=1 Tax=Spea bombifrons TaxID=233779 RepID=UPI00234A33A5|nr:39S ribosomal protein L55, mitochondrial [Spea bombifrons]XP_053322274.1 39S ribosomal protein L55, mitochondrial [Spea bombifrons]